MAKYPVEISDGEGIVDGLNYLLSGPAGLGQNFSGASYSNSAYLSGNFTEPYITSSAVVSNLYCDPISLSTGEFLDDRTVKFTFASAQVEPPFLNGNILHVTGASVADYNRWYGLIGVVECTTTYVIVRLTDPVSPQPADCTGGAINVDVVRFFSYETQYSFTPTDANGYATVTGATDRVVLNGQYGFSFNYVVNSGSDYLTTTVSVNRYLGVVNSTTESPKYNFIFDKTIASQLYSANGITGSGSVSFVVPSFVGIIDNPPPGYYWYVIEFSFLSLFDEAHVKRIQTKQRGLTVQVVKE